MSSGETGAVNDNVQIRVCITGLVQGVGFRFFAQREASVRSLRGYVRNLPDGSVEVVAEGPRHMLDGFLAFLRQGPGGANVDRIDTQWHVPEGHYSGFQIRH